MTIPTRFEDRLLVQLRNVVAANPDPASAPTAARARRLIRPRLAMAGGGLAAATAVVAIVASSGSNPAAAYAVDSGPNGTVSVTINSLRDANGLQSALRAKGIPADVDYAPATAAAPCPGGPPKIVEGKGEKGLSSVHVDHPQAGSGPSFSTNGAAPESVAGAPGVSTSSVRHNEDGSTTFGIDPGQLKPGERVHITTSDGRMDSVGISIGAHAC